MSEVNKLIPELRFPEFKNERKWKEEQLGDVAKFDSGGTPSKEVIEYWDGNIPWISASSMHNLVADKSELYITDIAVKDGASISKKGNILILVRGSMLFKRIPICIAGMDVSFNQDVKSLELKKEIDNIFFLYVLISNESNLLESVTSTGIGAGKLDTDGLKKLVLKVPSNKEQQKIASCLSSLDEIIAAHRQKLELLKEHKKSLMQTLFPQEGEKVPTYRFPEFVNDGEWEEKELGKVAKIKSGSTPLRSNNLFYEGGTIPWVKTTDLNNEFITQTEEKITEFAKARINPVGSVMVAMYGGFNQIGRTGYLKIPAATNQALSVLNANQKELFPLYLLMYLNAKVYLWKTFAGSSRKDPNITGNDVSKFPIHIPPTIKEQQKIASCLSSLDELITAQADKIEQLKLHKKGLMQGLFPKMSEL